MYKYNFADGRICVIPSFKSRHSFFNEYFSHCFSNSVYIQAHTGKLLNIISSQFRNACWVKWHSQIIHSLTTFNKWWGHHHHTFKKEYCHWQVYDFRNWTVHQAVLSPDFVRKNNLCSCATPFHAIFETTQFLIWSKKI